VILSPKSEASLVFSALYRRVVELNDSGAGLPNSLITGNASMAV